MAHKSDCWAIKDTAILDELLQILAISHQDVTILGELHEQAQTISVTLADTFYTRLHSHPHTRAFLVDIDPIQLHTMFGAWFADLFSGEYDETYARYRLHIGTIHAKIGLPIRYPLMMMDVVLSYAKQVIALSLDPEQANRAFEKVFALDIALLNQAYEDYQISHLAELVGGENLARLLLTGDNQA